MAVQDNVWNPTLNRWENPIDQTWMTPQGNWTNAGGMLYNPNSANPQWFNPNDPIGKAAPKIQTQQYMPQQQQQQGAYSPQAGYGWDLQNMDYAWKTAHDQLLGQQAKDLAAIDNAAKQQLQQAHDQISLLIAQKQIDAATGDLMKKLAQQESEFSRTQALEQAKFQHQQELDKLSGEIAKAAEQRQERALQSSLSANPTDWVNYQFYKRGLTNPGMNPSAASGLGTENPTMIDGTPYSPSAPASSDQQIQTMATALFAPPTGVAAPSPGAGTGSVSFRAGNTGIGPGGTGAFGTQIPNANQFSRGLNSNSSDTDLAMIAGLLRAGVDYTGSGQRTAIDPAEWMDTAKKWWIPTEQESAGMGAGTKYS